MSAILSECGTYRYRLEREVNGLLGSKVVAFVMVNPSTADAETDDATVRKVIGFARRMSARRVLVGNLFAYRATDIKALRDAPDPIGAENDAHLRRILGEADICIVAWGALAKLPPNLRRRWARFHDMATAAGTQLMCLGIAQDGHPLHPCMIGYERPVIEWRRP
ncbi:DUF1643 domain-containing protein [Methylobacterium fujisawaense]